MTFATVITQLLAIEKDKEVFEVAFANRHTVKVIVFKYRKLKKNTT